MRAKLLKIAKQSAIFGLLCFAAIAPRGFAEIPDTRIPAVEQLKNYARFNTIYQSEQSAPIELSIKNFISALDLSLNESNYNNLEIAEKTITSEEAAETSISNLLEVWNTDKQEISLRNLKLKAFVQYGSAAKNREKTGLKNEFSPFYKHIRDAIAINMERKRIYSSLSNGKTKSLSGKLILFEYSLIPVAKIFDLWGKKLRQKGIPVLELDFVSMANIASAESKIPLTNCLNENIQKDVKKLMKDYFAHAFRLAANEDFAILTDYSRSFLKNIEKIEKENNIVFPLIKHLAESVGLAASNAKAFEIKYQRQSNRFYSAFIRAQLIGLVPFGNLDFKANKFHTQGIGILVNDLPAISF